MVEKGMKNQSLSFTMSPSTFVSLLLFFISIVNATTEWWGDLRAHINPPRAPAFYDVTYDDGQLRTQNRTIKF